MTARSSLAFVCLFGCYQSHGVVGERADGSPEVDASLDADGGDASVSECEGEGASVCGCIGGMRRCDTCALPCPEGSSCWRSHGVCRPLDRDGAPREDLCELRLDDLPAPGSLGLTLVDERGCSRGWACAVSLDAEGTVASPYRGVCMPPPYCAEVGAASPPVAEPIGCLYADGTPGNPPPAGTCPASTNEHAPFCGAACGWEMCPPGRFDEIDDPRPSCVGVSSARAFGICSPTLDERCLQAPVGDTAEELNTQLLGRCREAVGEACACFVPIPQETPPGHEHGFLVPRSSCRVYAQAYPEGVRCVDATWSPI